MRIAAGTLAAGGALLALVVTPWFAILPAVVGGLAFSGLTDTCGMATLPARLPYNRRGSSDTAAMVRALREGVEPGDRPGDAGQAGCGTCR